MADDLHQNNLLFKQSRAIFNKITAIDSVSQILIQQFEELIYEESQDRLVVVVGMYLEKVANEPVFLDAYVQFAVSVCKPSVQQRCKHNQLFRKAIITECQKQFERKVLNFDSIEQLELLMHNINVSENSAEKEERQTIYDEERRNLTRKSILYVRLIGELFNKDMLTPNIIVMCCIKGLLDRNSEHKLECLCNLLTTVGAKITGGLKDPTHDTMINDCFKTMAAIVDNKNQNTPICSRLRCLILNVIDLRKNNWQRRQETVIPVESCRRMYYRRSHNKVAKK